MYVGMNSYEGQVTSYGGQVTNDIGDVLEMQNSKGKIQNWRKRKGTDVVEIQNSKLEVRGRILRNLSVFVVNYSLNLLEV